MTEGSDLSHAVLPHNEKAMNELRKSKERHRPSRLDPPDEDEGLDDEKPPPNSTHVAQKLKREIALLAWHSREALKAGDLLLSAELLYAARLRKSLLSNPHLRNIIASAYHH